MYNKLLIIFFVFVFSSRSSSQNIVDLCVGETHNFSVPYNNGSTYNWWFQDNFITPINSGNGTEHIVLKFDTTGLFKLFIKEFHLNGCTGIDSVLIEVHDMPSPIISTIDDIYLCPDEIAIINIQNSNQFNSFLWSDGSVESNLVINDSGQYSVLVSDIYGCTKLSDTINVNKEGPIFIDFSIDGLCTGNNTVFKSLSSSAGSAINLLRWDLGNNSYIYGDSIFYNFGYTGNYEVELFIETEIGCQKSLVKDLNIFENPKADFSYYPLSISTSNPELNLVNKSTNITNSTWVFDDTSYLFLNNPTYTYEKPGLHEIKLIVKDINECKDSISKNIIVYYDFIIYVPNSFTPNSDGNNDFFKPLGFRMDRYMSYQFSIFNKWGEIVFSTDNQEDGWSGDEYPSGIYNWMLFIKDELGEIRKEVGSVNLIK